MADVGKSQCRQIGNLGNSPAGKTGQPLSSRGEAYFNRSSTRDALNNKVSHNVGPKGPYSPVGNNISIPNRGEYYSAITTFPDNLVRSSRSGGGFGGASGFSGQTQADTGPLPLVTIGGSSLTTYFLMRGRDPDCVLQPSYVYWTVTGTPDTTGAHYVGSHCGVHALTDIIIEITWKQ